MLNSERFQALTTTLRIHYTNHSDFTGIALPSQKDIAGDLYFSKGVYIGDALLF